MIKKTTVSIIIPCFNAKKYIKNCLYSILRSSFSNYEIIIVDDGSTDGSVEWLKSIRHAEFILQFAKTVGLKPADEANKKQTFLPEIPRPFSPQQFISASEDKKILKRVQDDLVANKPSKSLYIYTAPPTSSRRSDPNLHKAPTQDRRQSIPLRVIFNKWNLGAAKSRNIGAKTARGKYLVFLDADTEIENGCLEVIVKTFEKDKKVGAIQTKLLNGKSKKIDAAGHFLSPFGFPYEIGIGESENKHSKKKIIFAGRSAGLAVRKNVFEKISGFDEDYLIYGEDTDLCWRIWLAGYRVYYLPQARVYHFQKSSLTKKTNYRIFYEGAKNNTCNILKNAPLKILLWMLPLHILGWVFLSLKLILQGRFGLAVWVYKGLGWNIKSANKILRKRKEVAPYTTENNKCSQIMFGKIGFKNFFLKGLKWFKNV
jgi:hypothetical protein